MADCHPWHRELTTIPTHAEVTQATCSPGTSIFQQAGSRHNSLCTQGHVCTCVRSRLVVSFIVVCICQKIQRRHNDKTGTMCRGKYKESNKRCSGAVWYASGCDVTGGAGPAQPTLPSPNHCLSRATNFSSILPLVLLLSCSDVSDCHSPFPSVCTALCFDCCLAQGQPVSSHS